MFVKIYMIPVFRAFEIIVLLFLVHLHAEEFLVLKIATFFLLLAIGVNCSGRRDVLHHVVVVLGVFTFKKLHAII